jgi:hypothetical protein
MPKMSLFNRKKIEKKPEAQVEEKPKAQVEEKPKGKNATEVAVRSEKVKKKKSDTYSDGVPRIEGLSRVKMPKKEGDKNQKVRFEKGKYIIEPGLSDAKKWKAIKKAVEYEIKADVKFEEQYLATNMSKDSMKAEKKEMKDLRYDNTVEMMGYIDKISKVHEKGLPPDKAAKKIFKILKEKRGANGADRFQIGRPFEEKKVPQTHIRTSRINMGDSALVHSKELSGCAGFAGLVTAVIKPGEPINRIGTWDHMRSEEGKLKVDAIADRLDMGDQLRELSMKISQNDKGQEVVTVVAHTRAVTGNESITKDDGKKDRIIHGVESGEFENEAGRAYQLSAKENLATSTKELYENAKAIAEWEKKDKLALMKENIKLQEEGKEIIKKPPLKVLITEIYQPKSNFEKHDNSFITQKEAE